MAEFADLSDPGAAANTACVSRSLEAVNVCSGGRPPIFQERFGLGFLYGRVSSRLGLLAVAGSSGTGKSRV